MTQVHLFAGTAGVSKRQVLSSLADHICMVDEVTEAMRLRHVQTYDLHDFLPDFSDSSVFLGLYPSRQKEVLRQAWKSLYEKIRDTRPEIALVGFHASFYRDHQVRFAHPWSAIRALSPLSITVLIDDVYHVWQRIEGRNLNNDTSSHYSIAELFTWRTIEYEYAKSIGEHLYRDRNIPVWLFAVKHFKETLRRLLFEPSIQRCYVSFPITNIRNNPEQRMIMDTMRDKLSRMATVFDPLTIDEKVLEAEHHRLLEHGDTDSPVSIGPENRWPLTHSSDRLAVFNPEQKVSLPRRYVRELLESGTDFRTIIDDNVRSRDFILCTQAEFLAIYRPYFGGRPSLGATAEAHFATHAEPRKRFTFWPLADGPRSAGFFADFGVLYESEEEWFNAIHNFTGGST